MIDPLGQFSWPDLHAKYDVLCKRFNPMVPYLDCFCPRPSSDRSLYYALRQRVAVELSSSDGIGLQTFQAMLYWKLYSRPAAVSRTCKRLIEDGDLRQQASKGLTAASFQLYEAPVSGLNIISEIQKLGSHAVWGMKSSTALPVRATFLHFIHPAMIPIFDKQVLLAVGVSEKGANQKLKFLEEYLAHATQLAQTHSLHFSNFQDETPVRLVDMALWVVRGGCS